MSTSTRFNLKVFARVLKKRHPGKPHFTFFSPKTLVRLFILKEVKPSTESEMIKLLTFDSLFQPQRLRMTMAVTFSRPFPPKWRWFARAHYTVLSIYYTHSHFKINIFCSVISPPPDYHVKVTRMLLKRKEGRREGSEGEREGGKGREGTKGSYNLNYLTTRMIISSWNLMYNLLRIFRSWINVASQCSLTQT